LGEGLLNRRLPAETSSLTQAILIYNPVAGSRSARRESQIHAAAEALRQQGVPVQLSPTSAPGQGREMARSAVASGLDLILVCGGDGTINEVINGMAMSPSALGILPGGTANIAAKELGLPHNPVQAALELRSWSSRRIALGRATWSESAGGDPAPRQQTRFFLSVAGLGFDAHVISRMPADSARRFGVTAYVWAGLTEFFGYSFPMISCRTDAEEFAATFATVHRSRRYAGWFEFAPGQSFFERKLTLCAFTSRSKWRYAIYSAAVILRRHAKLKDVKVISSSSVVCGADTARPIQFELDGELAGKLPATFEVVPDALTVLAP
jgi:diacylglycerol kinase (ATP)